MRMPINNNARESDFPAEAYEPISHDSDDVASHKHSLLAKAERSHKKVPGLRKIPLPAIGIILLVALVNGLVWVVAGVLLVCFLFHELLYGEDIHLSCGISLWRNIVIFGA